MAMPEHGSLDGRRGGYGDGGGLTLDNKLPLAAPICVRSDAELKQEIDAIQKKLGSLMDWVERIHALIRLEGIVRGGADHWPSLLESLRGLKDPIVAQISDRRSAVSRQACHVVAIMAAHLGSRFEPLAIFFIPVIMKVLAITVQVMADAANECLHSILHYCRSGKILPKVVDFIVSDKSVKIRQHCIRYLLQVYDTWSPSQCDRFVEITFPALKASLQDSSSETRTISRTAVSALCHAFPEKGKTFLKSLEGSLKQKILQSCSAYEQGSFSFPVAEIDQPALCTTPVKKAQDAPASNPLPLDSDLLVAEPVMEYSRIRIESTPGPDQNNVVPCTPPKSPTERSVDRHSYNKQPSSLQPQNPVFTSERAPMATAARFHIGSSSVGSNKRKGRLRRRPRTPEPDEAYITSSISKCDRVKTVTFSLPSGPCRLETMPIDRENDVQRPSPIHEEKEISFNQLLTKAANEYDWKIKESIILELSKMISEERVTQSDFMNCLQSVANLLCLYLEDPHHKVRGAALQLTEKCFEVYHGVTETAFTRLAPYLFAKLLDQRNHVRTCAARVLQSCAGYYTADVFLAACLHALWSLKTPGVISEIFNFVCQYLQEEDKKRVPDQASLLRRWICQLCHYIADKNLSIRRAASNALDHLLKAASQEHLHASLSQADPQEKLILMRGLRQKYPECLPNCYSVTKTPRKSRTPEPRKEMDQDQAQGTTHSPKHLSTEKRDTTPRKRRCEMFSSLSEMMIGVLTRCSTLKEVEKLDTISALTDKISCTSTEETQPLEPPVMQECLNLLLTSRSAVREQTLVLLNECFNVFPCDLQQKQCQELLSSLFLVASDPSDSVVLATDVLLATLLKHLPISGMYVACIACTLSSNGSYLASHASFVCFAKLFCQITHALPAEEVEKRMMEADFQMVNFLIERWSCDRLDVRKTAVAALAQLGAKIGGEQMEPFLKCLTEPQRKLLRLYVEKLL